MVIKTVLLFVYGLVLGSFLNAVTWRIHEKCSFTRGRSVCEACGHELAAADLVPVLSWLGLRGRCQYCRKPISWQHPLFELVTAAVFALSFWVLRPSTSASWVNFGFWIYFVCIMMILAAYDLRWMLLPNKVLLPAIAVAAVHLPVMLALGAPRQAVLGPVEAAALAGGAFYALAALGRGKWLGGGDIKLVFWLGLILGLQKTALMLLLAFNSAAIIGVGLIISRRRGRRDLIPFGPFLIAGSIVAMLWGSHLIGWYLNVTGLNLVL